MKHQNLRLIQNVIYMSIYEATDLQKKETDIACGYKKRNF